MRDNRHTKTPDRSVSRLIRQKAYHQEVRKCLRHLEQMLPCEDPIDAGSRAEDACGALGHLLLPLGDPHRVNVEILGDLLDDFDAIERFERHAGLEFGVVSFAFSLHFVCVRFGLQADPSQHHNHILASGLIFWGRLIVRARIVEMQLTP